MRVVIQNLLFGLLVIAVCWLITFNNHFLFSIFTLFVIPLFLLTYYAFTAPFKWWIIILAGLLCFILDNVIMDYVIKEYPTIQLVDDESFPLSSYYIFFSFLFVILRSVLDGFLIIIIPKKFTRLPLSTKFFKSRNR